VGRKRRAVLRREEKEKVLSVDGDQTSGGKLGKNRRVEVVSWGGKKKKKIPGDGEPPAKKKEEREMAMVLRRGKVVRTVCSHSDRGKGKRKGVELFYSKCENGKEKGFRKR